MGLRVVRDAADFYRRLPDTLKSSIHGFTLMNEPGHLLEGRRAQVLEWVAAAADAYREDVVSKVPRGVMVPFLYVNLIETSGLTLQDMAQFMQRAFSPPELSAWAVLDVHHYFAWGFTGCEAGTRAGCVYACDEPIAGLSARLEDAADDFAGKLRSAAGMHGVPHVASTEWSLATHADSSAACKGDGVLGAMYKAGVGGCELFTQIGLSHGFEGRLVVSNS